MHFIWHCSGRTFIKGVWKMRKVLAILIAIAMVATVGIAFAQDDAVPSEITLEWVADTLEEYGFYNQTSDYPGYIAMRPPPGGSILFTINEENKSIVMVNYWPTKSSLDPNNATFIQRLKNANDQADYTAFTYEENGRGTTLSAIKAESSIAFSSLKTKKDLNDAVFKRMRDQAYVLVRTYINEYIGP